MLDQDALSPGHAAPPLRLLVVAARRDPEASAGRILAAAAEDATLEARLLCGAAGIEPPPGVRIFQPHDDHSFLAEAEPGYDAAALSQLDADLLRKLGAWLTDWAPEVVHLHDLAPFGMELIGLLRRRLPSARILVSLSPDLARRIGITGPPQGFLRTAPLRRFLAECTLLLPCETLLPACLAFGLDPARLLVQASLPPDLMPTELPPLGRFLVVAAFPKGPAEARLLATAAELLAGTGPRLRIELHGDGQDQPPLRDAAAVPGSPLALVPGDAPRGALLARAHLVLMPDAEGADPEGLARLALALRRPVICAGQGPLATQLQAGRDAWHCAMNPVSLADLLLALHETPGRVAAMADSLLPPPSPAEGAAALFGLYREVLSDPSRIAHPARI
ncbi:hypothetical protein [Sediminicoccus sp. KRV36]|uniref:hypothetical protein n=1 Tax=Sediminicoccus sp. KRV36 TaxID=3133721 RepID=UPI00200E6172|nr:hypothetical protein [Sediminicoccus rosea]UPY37167.1 hypothetical protein LHU95_00290 [Sediminicoccus rosea]